MPALCNGGARRGRGGGTLASHKFRSCLSAWLRAGLFLTAAAFLLIGVSPVQAQAAPRVLHVNPAAGDDANPGTIEKPFRTLQKALQDVQPGETVKLASGIYQEANETRRAGAALAPIVVEPEAGAQPVLDGRGNTLNGIRIVHSYYILRNLEIRNTKEGVRIERATGVILENSLVHHVNNEGIRLHYFAAGNTVRNNKVWATGLAGNAEGIYIGTAPEQRYKNGGQPDASTHNIISGNEVYDVGEGIDVKEDSSFNTISGNIIHHARDPLSGGINVRADENQITGNLSYGNAGAGFRFGGDVTTSPLYGAGYHYGVRNALRDNMARDNAGHGYKFMNGPQDADTSNTGAGNGGSLYYYGAGVVPFVVPTQAPVAIAPAASPRQATNPAALTPPPATPLASPPAALPAPPAPLPSPVSTGWGVVAGTMGAAVAAAPAVYLWRRRHPSQ